ncbi:hypothetical protein EDB87DRAFT_1822187 [Lactarius vividus]|nr:hypothetical protein EDB87DRAFT_1822187 [Lactarius vividus]
MPTADVQTKTRRRPALSQEPRMLGPDYDLIAGVNIHVGRDSRTNHDEPPLAPERRFYGLGGSLGRPKSPDLSSYAPTSHTFVELLSRLLNVWGTATNRRSAWTSLRPAPDSGIARHESSGPGSDGGEGGARIIQQVTSSWITIRVIRPVPALVLLALLFSLSVLAGWRFTVTSQPIMVVLSSRPFVGPSSHLAPGRLRYCKT